MNDRSMNYIMKIILPIILIIAVFIVNKYAGLVCLLAYLLFACYLSRSTLYKLIANIKYARGDMDKTLHWYRKAYESDKAKAGTAITYAYLLLKGGNIEESEKVFNRIFELKLGQDEEMLAKSNYALLLWKKGDLDGAVDTLEKVIEKYKTTTIYGSLGYLLILKGDLDRALKFNLEAYEYNNTNPVILDNLGQTYYLRGEQDKAVEIYEKLMSHNPTFPSAYYNYGLVLLKSADYEKALENMEKALKFNFSPLSTISKSEIEAKIEEIKKEMEKSRQA